MDNVSQADGDTLDSYLRGLGVRYIIWQYKRPPPPESRANEGLKQALKSLWTEKHVVFDDGKRVLFDIEKL